jgi:hypothetical protein
MGEDSGFFVGDLIMGWLFTFRTLDELIEHLTRPHESDKTSSRTITHRLCHEDGIQVLWSLVEVTAKVQGAQARCGYHSLAAGETVRYILCDLLESYGGRWGYKSLDEFMQPYYYSCPLSYLPQAKEVSPTWRAKVREWHDPRRKPGASSPATV